MLYTASTASTNREVARMKRYYVVIGHENDIVAPDKHDLELLKKGVMTDKGFVVNYEMKLRSRGAYEWMQRVAEEAIHEEVVLLSKDEGSERNYRIMLAEMMISMFGGKMNIRYLGELK